MMFNSYSYRITSEDNSDGLAHLWEFHDFRMLVDVDLPIFGGGKFPSVSIHLSEETKPISVLTGMDIMLDQLMCNLSETILVYHEQGLVKDYEVLVKEDIPHIVGSEFDPSNLKNITENIMSFFAKNMTEQGHTYWLFREKGSNQMKLYDLTSLCPELACNPNWNPFLVPVISLLYKLSLNLMEKTAKGRPEKVSNVIYGLLNAAAKLSENVELAELKACIHYSLAGVYLMYGSVASEKVDPVFSRIVDSLEEILTDGYAQITSSIQIDTLTSSSSNYSYDNDQSTTTSNTDTTTSSSTTTSKSSTSTAQSKRPPNVKIESECASQALEHCLQALTALDGYEVDVTQVCPFVPDSADDVAALRSVPSGDPLAIRLVFRQSIIVRAATAYLVMVYQAICINRYMKTYNYCRCGVQLCGAVLAMKPAARHVSVCHTILQVFLSSLSHACSEIFDSVVDTAILDSGITYRDRRILDLSTAAIVVRGVLNFDMLWTVNESGTKSRDEWVQMTETIVFRCLHFLKEYPNAQTHVEFPPLASTLCPIERSVSRLAMSLMMTAAKCTHLGKGVYVLAGVEDRQNADKAMEYVAVANKLYKRALDVLKGYNKKELVDCQVVLHANSAATGRLEYSIRLLTFEEPVTSRPIRALVDEICTSYRSIFEKIRPDFETKDGFSVYANTLIDFGFALYTFAHHLREETAPEWKEQRMHYLEAAVRALRDVCKKKQVPRSARTKATEKLTETYYVLSRMKTDYLYARANMVSARNYRTMYREVADFVQVVEEYLVQICYEDVRPAAKDFPLAFADFPIGLAFPDTQRIDLCIKTLQWMMGLSANITEIEKDAAKCTERYEKLWERAQLLLKTMNQEFRNNASLKQAYICLLHKLPTGVEATRTFIIESLAKAITALGGQQLHPLG
ncbi:hypothetical protein Aduo_018167 [Ancylostoma duodenale]